MKVYLNVAPHAGARIETEEAIPQIRLNNVAPHAGARIETIAYSKIKFTCSSLPTRERELKLENSFAAREYIKSLPTRERELKLVKV